MLPLQPHEKRLNNTVYIGIIDKHSVNVIAVTTFKLFHLQPSFYHKNLKTFNTFNTNSIIV